jgi:YegS/Rv2252/BmrU family lipid kinase
LTAAVRDALLIYNPTAGRRRHRGRLGALVEALATDGWRAEPAATAAPGDATRLAAAAAAGGADAVFVYAGDGTVREAAAGLLGGEVPLAILPGGTANVLAHALGLPPRPLAAARAHARSERRPFDVGLCGATPFLMMASAGLDAAVVAHLEPALKTRLGRTGIVLQGFRELWRYPYPPIAVTADGRPLPPATLAAVCNIPHYGGRFAIAPAARWDDRRLDLVAFRGTGPRATLAFALALATGRHLARDDVSATVVEEVVLDAPPGACLQVDGDPCAEPFPATVRLAEERLPVLVPVIDR